MHRHAVSRFCAISCIGMASVGTSGVVVGQQNAPGVDDRATATELAVRTGLRRVNVSGTRIGTVALGQPLSAVQEAFEALLGNPTDIRRTGPLPRIQQRCFGGEELAIVEWSGVVLVFVGASASPIQNWTWFDFRIDENGINDKVLGFPTSLGARIGDTAARWRSLHPDAQSFPGEPNLVGPFLVLTDGLHALIDEGTDRVASVSARSPIFCE